MSDMPDYLYAGKSEHTLNIPEKTPNAGFIWCSYSQAPEGYEQMTKYIRVDTHNTQTAEMLAAIVELRGALETVEIQLKEDAVNAEARAAYRAAYFTLNKTKKWIEK